MSAFIGKIYTHTLPYTHIKNNCKIFVYISYWLGYTISFVKHAVKILAKVFNILKEFLNIWKNIKVLMFDQQSPVLTNSAFLEHIWNLDISESRFSLIN